MNSVCHVETIIIMQALTILLQLIPSDISKIQYSAAECFKFLNGLELKGP